MAFYEMGRVCAPFAYSEIIGLKACQIKNNVYKKA